MFFENATRALNDVITDIDGVELDMLMKEDAGTYQFIDVRTPEEFRYRSIKGFTNVPLQSLGRYGDQLSMEKPVVIICASGARSMSAAGYLKQLGFKSIFNVSGGISYYRG